MLRDYFAEVITAVEVSLPNWTVKHLTVWTELVDTKLKDPMGVTDVDLEAAEEATQAALYQETRSKLSLLIRNRWFQIYLYIYINTYACIYIYISLFLDMF